MNQQLPVLGKEILKCPHARLGCVQPRPRSLPPGASLRQQLRPGRAGAEHSTLPPAGPPTRPAPQEHGSLPRQRGLSCSAQPSCERVQGRQQGGSPSAPGWGTAARLGIAGCPAATSTGNSCRRTDRTAGRGEQPLQWDHPPQAACRQP